MGVFGYSCFLPDFSFGPERLYNFEYTVLYAYMFSNFGCLESTEACKISSRRADLYVGNFSPLAVASLSAFSDVSWS